MACIVDRYVFAGTLKKIGEIGNTSFSVWMDPLIPAQPHTSDAPLELDFTNN